MNVKSSPLAPEAIKADLVARRQELARRLERVDRDLHREAGALSADFAEQATEAANDEVLAAIGASVRAELSDLDAALGRLATGHYGRCSRCSAPIEPQRLAAVPYTLTCSHCAQGR